MQLAIDIIKKQIEKTGSRPRSSQQENLKKSAPLTSSNLNDNEQTKRTQLLFSKFAAYYGHIWRSQFPNKEFLEFAKKEWEKALKEFSDEILNKAIISCLNFYELPPTLPQLITSCRSETTRALITTYKESEPISHEEHLKIMAHLQQLHKNLKENKKC